MTEFNFTEADYTAWLAEQEPPKAANDVVVVVDAVTPPAGENGKKKRQRNNSTARPTRLEFPVERQEPYPNPNYAAVWLMATPRNMTTHAMRSEGSCWLLVAIRDKADADPKGDTSHVPALWLQRDMKAEQDRDCHARYFSPVTTELSVSRNHLISVLPMWEWDSKIGRLWLSHKIATQCDHAFNQWSNSLTALDPVRSLCQPW